MRTYIAPLRRINVSGQKKIKMPHLREILENIGFKDVNTYIQSGNMVFKTDPTDIQHLEEKIKNRYKIFLVLKYLFW